MSLPALYTLAADYREASEQLADLELDEQAVADTLEGLQGTLEVKATNVAMFCRNVEALAAQIKEAEAAMAARRKQLERRAERIRGYLKTCLEIADVREVSCPYFTIRVRANPPSVVVEDLAKLPPDYLVVPPTPPPVADKRAIADDLKAGKPVPGAYLDTTKTRLEIR